MKLLFASLDCVLALLTLQLAVPAAHAEVVVPDCAALEGSTEGGAPLRSPPVLSSGTVELTLQLEASRPADSTVRIGDLLVKGAPVFAITPQQGARVDRVDPIPRSGQRYRPRAYPRRAGPMAAPSGRYNRAIC